MDEKLLKMASDADFTITYYNNGKAGVVDKDGHDIDEELTRFAALVQRATAEDCAKVCEGMPDREYNYPLTREEEGVERGWETGRMNCATAIRTKYQLK